MKRIHKTITSLTLLIIFSGLLMGCLEQHTHTPTKDINITVNTPSLVEQGDIYYINITLDTNNTSIAGLQFSFTYNTYQSTFMALLPGTLFPTENTYIKYGTIDISSGTYTGIAFTTLNTTINGTGTIAHLVFTANTKFNPTITLFNTIIGDNKGKELEHTITYG